MHNVFIDLTRKRHNRADHIPIEDVMATLSLPANQPRRLEFRDLLRRRRCPSSSGRWCCLSAPKG